MLKVTSRRGFTLIELLVVIAIIAILAAILFPVFAQAREKARATACLSNDKQIGSALMMYSQDFDETLPAWNQGVLPGGPGCCPTAMYWDALLLPYVKNANPAANQRGGVWRCPSSPNTDNYRTMGYSQVLFREGWETNSNGTAYRSPKIAIIEAPASCIFVGDGGSGGRLAPPWWFQSYTNRGGSTTVVPPSPKPSVGATDTTTNAWEWPDMHNQGANYVFCDGHAKWLKDEIAYPPGMRRVRNATDSKVVFKACVDWFAAAASERAWCKTQCGTAICP